MIYICKEPGCVFSSFNEKALELHKQEKHRTATITPQKKEEPVVTGVPDPTSVQPETEKKKNLGLNFMLELKGKKVTIEGNNGKVVTGTLKKYNSYELKIETETGLRTMFKHSLFMIWETDKHQPEKETEGWSA